MGKDEPRTVGNLLRLWRERRQKSQLELALDAEISTRHLSFVETGRARPSREMILLLAQQLAIPLRERNKILIAGGYAPIYSEKSFDDESLAAARLAIELILKGHEPFPALAIDRGWNMVAANKTVALMVEGVAPELLVPPVNVLRLSLHPDGLAPRILNLAEWRGHLLSRLRREVENTADERLEALFTELRRFSFPAEKTGCGESHPEPEIIVPLKIETRFGKLSLISATTVFGTPLSVALEEIALETFFPANEPTAKVFRQLTF